MLGFLLLACAVGFPTIVLQRAAGIAPQPDRDLVARDIAGLGVFGSDGQRVGKVARVNATSTGVVKDVEIRSDGFLGLFAKTYVLPAETLSKRGGRLDLVMTSGEARQFKK